MHDGICETVKPLKLDSQKPGIIRNLNKQEDETWSNGVKPPQKFKQKGYSTGRCPGNKSLNSLFKLYNLRPFYYLDGEVSITIVSQCKTIKPWFHISCFVSQERLDFSCAMFGPDGGLVANAPHIPVHLGAMQETVQYQVCTELPYVISNNCIHLFENIQMFRRKV